MLRRLLAIVLALSLPTDAFAGGPCSGVKGGCGRSSYRSSARSSSSSAGGTVHVRGYYRKDGTYVRPHTRRAPGTAGSSSGGFSSPAPRVEARTTARRGARTQAWGGTSSAYDDEDLFAPAPEEETAAETLRAVHAGTLAHRQAQLAANREARQLAEAEAAEKALFTLYLKNSRGKGKPIVNFQDDGGTYWVTSASGGGARYPKNIVERIDTVDGLPAMAVVKRVVDGDTVELEGGEKCRLIGIETPETVHPSKPVEAFGKEASAFTKRQLEGKEVRLVYDQANAVLSHRDRYGRLLVYVHRRDFDFNAEIIKQGYAHAYVEFPHSRLEEFRGYEQAAREDGRGLWVRQPR